MSNALLFAAGLGTRLRPLTDAMPKALVPIAGRPLIDYVVEKLRAEGFDNIVVNAHHLAQQLVEHLAGTGIKVSVEEELLDTGGGLRRAMPLFGNDEPILIHNVDILSNAPLCSFFEEGREYDAALLVSARRTNRYLLFDDTMRLVGWTDETTGEVRSPYPSLNLSACRKYAFAGIHVVSQQFSALMEPWGARFAIIDFYLHHCRELNIRGVVQDDLRLIDVGKKENLQQAEAYIKEHQ